MSLWDSSAFWGIAGIVGGIVVSFVFSQMQKRRKTLDCQINSKTLLKASKIANIPDLNLRIGDDPISNLVSTRIDFVNSGNTTIARTDFPSVAPLKINASGRFFNIKDISADSIQSDNTSLNPSLRVINNNEIEIAFEYLKPAQHMSITLLHDGELSVSGDLISGVLRKYTSKAEEQNRLQVTGMALFSIIVSLAVTMLAGVMVSSSIFSRSNVNHGEIDLRMEQMQAAIESLEERDDLTQSLLVQMRLMLDEKLVEPDSAEGVDEITPRMESMETALQNLAKESDKTRSMLDQTQSMLTQVRQMLDSPQMGAGSDEDIIPIPEEDVPLASFYGE